METMGLLPVLAEFHVLNFTLATSFRKSKKQRQYAAGMKRLLYGTQRALFIEVRYNAAFHDKEILREKRCDPVASLYKSNNCSHVPKQLFTLYSMKDILRCSLNNFIPVFPQYARHLGKVSMAWIQLEGCVVYVCILFLISKDPLIIKKFSVKNSI